MSHPPNIQEECKHLSSCSGAKSPTDLGVIEIQKGTLLMRRSTTSLEKLDGMKAFKAETNCFSVPFSDKRRVENKHA